VPRYAGLLPLMLFVSACSDGDGSPQNESAEAFSAQVSEATHPPDKAVASRDGVIIFYDDRGSSDQAIVFVHGWNCDRDYWQLQRDYFAEDYRVISIDLAGHGQSAHNRSQWSIVAFADDVAAVVRKLDLTDVTLVGHSMGGLVVLEAAVQLGERVTRVVGVDTLRDADERFSDKRLDALVDALETDYAATVVDFAKSMFVDASHARVRDFVVRDMAAGPPDVAIGSLIAFAQYNPMSAIDALQVPFSLINSDYEETDVDVIAGRVRDFQFIEVSDVGHFIMLEDPVAFTNHLNAILNHRKR